MTSRAPMRRPRWMTWRIGLALWLLVAGLVYHVDAAQAASPCDALRRGKPRYHHILVLDLSGSVLRVLPQMQQALTCYINMYAVQGEEVSILIFGADMLGSVKELRTLTVAPRETANHVNDLLRGVVIDAPNQTRTYFKPVANFLNGFLRQVRLEPTLLIMSDGKSDASSKQTAFREIAFASLGTRGVYRLPGAQGWQIALAGGRGLDLSAFLQGSKAFAPPETASNPMPRGAKPATPEPGASSVIDHCLVEPRLRVATPPRLVLRPSWQPWRSSVRGRLTLQIQHDCVSRFRDFRVELRQGATFAPLGAIQDALITEVPKAFSFDVAMAKSEAGVSQAVVRLLLDQGHTTRTIYPSDPPSLTLVEQTYGQTFGWPISVLCVLLAGAGLCVAIAKRRQQQRELRRPEHIKIPGGPSIALRPLQMVAIGGDGCQLSAPGLPMHTPIAYGEWRGVRGELVLRPAPPYRLQVGDQEITDAVTYQLGQPLLCLNAQGESMAFTIVAASERDLSFGAPVAGYSPDLNGASMPRFGVGDNDIATARMTPIGQNGSSVDAYI